MNKEKRWQVRTLVQYFVALLLILGTQVKSEKANSNSIIQVRLQSEENFELALKLSMLGGAHIAIEGTGFSPISQDNQVRFQSGNTGLQHLTFNLTPQNDDDASQSNTAEGQYYYTTPSVSEIFGLPLEAFNGANSMLPSGHHKGGLLAEQFRFFTKVFNSANEQVLVDPNQNNSKLQKSRLVYSVDATALLQQIVPSQVFKGQKVSFVTQPRQAFALHTSEGPYKIFNPQDLQIDRVAVDHSDSYDETLKVRRSAEVFAGYVGDQKPNKNSIPSVRFPNGHSYHMPSLRQCNFAGDQCWTLQTLPVVESIDMAEGFTTGGQILVITGSGFSSDLVSNAAAVTDSENQNQSVTVDIDGIECTVIESSDERITCLTGKAEKASLVGVQQPGLPGLTQKRTYMDHHPNFKRITKWTVWTDQTVTSSFEFLERDIKGKRQIVRHQGWFKAPESGNYKFYVSTSREARFYFNSQTPFDPQNAISSQDDFIFEDNSVCNVIGHYYVDQDWRQYFRTASHIHSQNNSRSEWIYLEKDQFYKIGAQSLQNSVYSFGHTVSVEFEKASTESHPKTNYKVQHLEITHDAVFEEWDITILNPDGESFKIVLAYPDQNDKTKIKLWTSEPISTKSDSARMKQVINKFYRQVYRNLNVVVLKTDYDAQDAVTSDASLIVKTVYNIRCRVLISFITISQISYTDKITDAAITFTPPQQKNISSPPLGGFFKVQCPDESGVMWSTAHLPYYSYGPDIQRQIDNSIPHLRFKTLVTAQKDYIYSQNGRTFQIQFIGYDGNPPDCHLVSDTDRPLTGSPNLRFIAETIREYGQNLLFEPIPMDMLYQSADKPQVSVKIDGLQAMCKNDNCGYIYTESTSLITGQSFSEQDRLLTIWGVRLPTENIEVGIGNELCDPASLMVSETQISCTLTDDPQAGDWDVEIASPLGLVPLDESMAQIVVDLQVEEVERELTDWEEIQQSALENSEDQTNSFDTAGRRLKKKKTKAADDLNVFGGDILIIRGKGFSDLVTGNEVIFGDDTICEIIRSTKKFISCKVQGFEKEILDLSDTEDITVSVKSKKKRGKKQKRKGRGNSYKQNKSKKVKCKPKQFKGLSVTPNSVSPIVKQDLVIEIDKNFPHQNLLPTDFTAILVDIKNKKKCPNVTIELKVLSVDSDAKSLTVRFPGAEPDTYYIRVTHVAEGRVDHKPLKLVVEAVVTKITTSKSSTGSNKKGSLLGGQLVTIEGTNFSPKAGQNIVNIGTVDCEIQSFSTSELVCQIQRTPYFANMSEFKENVYVYLGGSQQPTYDTNRRYTFTTPEATITDVATSFDTSLNKQKITLSGNGFESGDLDAIKVYLDGVLQNTISVTPTEAQIEITEMKSNSAALQIVMPDGFPAGEQEDLPAILTVEAGLVSITPPVGTSAGTTLTVRGFGFGIDTGDFNLFHEESNQLICREKQIIGFGEFTCLTIPVEIAASDTIKIQIASDQFECVNTQTPSDCKVQLDQTDQPIYSNAAQISPTQIRVTGEPFSDFENVLGIFQGVTSSSGEIISNTEVILTWDLGIPIAITPAPIEVRFWNDDQNSSNRRMLLENGPGEGTTFFIVFIESGFPGLTVDFSITQNTSNLVCSFAGGCAYEVSAPGLTSSLLSSDDNKIDFCGQECAVDVENSSDTTTICTLPAMPTIYSIDNFKMSKARPLAKEGVWSGTTSDVEQLAKLFDENEATVLSDPTPTNCFFQVDFPATYAARLNRLEFFINSLQDRSPFVEGNAKVQGSNDGGSSWTDIFVLDQNVHCGWNSRSFQSGSLPQYNAYRWQGAIEGSCAVGEIRLNGILAIDENNTEYECTPQVILNGSEVPLNSVTFDTALTPVLTSINKRFGSVLGGDSLTFTGTGFSASATTVVKIDNRECVVDSQSTTEITCTTSDKPYVPDVPLLILNIEGLGNVATQGLVFRYVSKWSDAQTWGSDLEPVAGDAVEIPKGQHLLVDIDSTPQLSFVVVEGSLIFTPESDETHQRTFDASYIMVRDGYFEAGTEEFPYTSQLTITMHSQETDPSLPIYGNKVLAVRVGQLEMHGKPRETVWTELESTAPAGSSQITLREPVDWAVGEQIAIASTDVSGRNSEQRTITAISDETTQPLITLDSPLEFSHYGAEYSAGGASIQMRAEVGLLSRNLKFQGDAATSVQNKYGAHILIHSPGDETSVGHIENAEFFNVGQAFKLNRYPINLSQMGFVPQSYIRNNSIHVAFNRAIAMNSVQYLRIQNNFVYRASGHAIFTEFAKETNNVIEDNLIMDTRASFSLLNTDMTPAAFLLQHPNNVLRRNRAAGADGFGFWYNPPTQAEGSTQSCSNTICPENAQIGAFDDNVAHSNGQYGLRIYENLIPREYPCLPLTFSGDTANPYPTNRPLVAEFRNLISFKNGKNGAIAESVGAVQFHDFKVADNRLAGIEVSRSDKIIDGFAKVVNGVAFGYSDNADSQLLTEDSPRGVIGPRTENFTIQGTKFVNFDINEAAALSDCSHCYVQRNGSTDSGARTITVRELDFDSASVPRRIKYEVPRRGIWRDEDGTLTGSGTPGYLAKIFKHYEDSCFSDQNTIDTFDNSLVCTDREIRRIVFYAASPASLNGLQMKLLDYDFADLDSLGGEQGVQDYVADENNYQTVQLRQHERPTNSWAMPFVTGQRYRIHWGEGQDFENMNFDLSERWQDTDKPILFNANYTALEAINVFKVTGDKAQIAEGTINELFPQGFVTATGFDTGDNYLPTDKKEIEFLVNGINPERFRLRLEGVQCLTCETEVDDNASPNDNDLDPTQVAWSDIASWSFASLSDVPQEGDSIVIPSNVNMVLDVAETPILARLEINGRLTFKSDMDVHLRSKLIWVRQGELFIGNQGAPYEMQGKITLFGSATSESLAISPSVTAGNKVLANTGTISVYGKERSRVSRLLLPANAGDTTLYLEGGLDWVSGDRIYLSPTAMQNDHSDYATLASYDAGSGLATLTAGLSFYHFGADSQHVSDYEGLDMRGEVILLTRNVLIQGSDEDAWGGQIFTTDIIDGAQFQSGTTTLLNTELTRMGQRDTTRAAIRFEGSYQSSQLVQNVVCHNSQAWNMYINFSSNLSVTQFSSIGSKQSGIVIDQSSNVAVDAAYIFDVAKRNSDQFTGAFLFCIYSNPKRGSICQNVSVVNSIVGGAIGAGFVAPGHSCTQSGESQTKFANNVAHSVKGAGHVIYRDPQEIGSQKNCFLVNKVQAYKNTDSGLVGQFETRKYTVKDVILVDNQKGLSVQAALDERGNEIVVEDSFIFGESTDIASDCPGSPMPCYCERKGGFMLSGSTVEDRQPLNLNNKPIWRIRSDSSFASFASVKNTQFKNFLANTACGNKQSIFFRNEDSRDYIAPHTFESGKFTQVDSEGFYYMEPAPTTWAVPEICGDFSCTAPQNTVLTFIGNSFKETMPAFAKKSKFQILAKNDGMSELSENCEEFDGWNGFYCKQEKWGVLVFESQDDDAFDRAVQPVILTETTGTYSNKLNAMSNRKESFYATNKRRSSFSAQLNTDNKEYTLQFSSSAPKKMRFELFNDINNKGIALKIPFSDQRAYTVKVDGQVRAEEKWDDKTNEPKPLKKQCGSNRQVGISNTLELFIKKGCLIELIPRDAIKTKLRLEWTLEEFYAEGGTTRFAERIAAALGIDSNRIKTVAVYQGSVIVDFFIQTILGESEPVEQLQEIKETLVDIVTTGIVDLGAPVLGLMSDDELLAGDPIPPQAGATATNGQNEVFGADSSAIVKDDVNLWDGMVSQNRLNEEKRAEYDEAKRNQKIKKTITKVIENARFAEATPVRKIALIIVILAVILASLTIYFLCKCLQRNERMLEIQAEVKSVQNRQDELVEIEAQLNFLDDQKIDFAQATRTQSFKKVNKADETSSSLNQNHSRSLSVLSIGSTLTTKNMLSSTSSFPSSNPEEADADQE